MRKNGIKLHYLISLLIILVILSAVSISGYFSMETQRKTITETNLQENYNYAQKLAENTNNQLNFMQNNLTVLANFVTNSSFTQEDLDIWYESYNDQFNTVFFVDTDAVIHYLSSSHVQEDDEDLGPSIQLDSVPVLQAIDNEEAAISAPYIGLRDDLIILMSVPVFSDEEELEGVLAGTISLEKNNVLQDTFLNHQYKDESYAYVVDQAGNIIYHPNKDNIGKNVANYHVVTNLLAGKSGSTITTNRKEIDNFAGYAPISSTNWGIVVQTPVTIMENTLHTFIKQMILLTTPFLIIMIIISWYLVSKITKPLNSLVNYTKAAQKSNLTTAPVKKHTKSNIYEVKQLYNQMNDYITLMNKHSSIDGLTGVLNRRVLNETLNDYIENNTPFSLLMIDIDHFKQINDTYGHLVGDEVLQQLGKLLNEITQANKASAFRFGGEEFNVILPDATITEAQVIAETLRKKFAEMKHPTKTKLTLSIGITERQDTDQHQNDIFTRADTALYHAKKTGRNKIASY